MQTGRQRIGRRWVGIDHVWLPMVNRTGCDADTAIANRNDLAIFFADRERTKMRNLNRNGTAVRFGLEALRTPEREVPSAGARLRVWFRRLEAERFHHFLK